MIEELKRILKSLEGRVVAFEFKAEKFNSVLNSNRKIITLDILDGVSKKVKKEKGKNKKISISSLCKRYKKNKIDTILIDTDVMDELMIYLIKETIYIGKKDLYLFGKKETVIHYLQKYKRYAITYDEKYFKDKAIVKINIFQAKNNKVMDKLYFLKDKIEQFIDLISNVLTS